MDKNDDTASGPKTVTTRIITTAEGQAVLIPAELAFEGGDQMVTLTKSGQTMTLVPAKARQSMEAMFAALSALPPESRFQPIERAELFDRDGE